MFHCENCTASGVPCSLFPVGGDMLNLCMPCVSALIRDYRAALYTAGVDPDEVPLANLSAATAPATVTFRVTTHELKEVAA